MAKRGQFGAFSGILETGVLASKILDYTGDDTDDRVIDLGDDYDLVIIVERTNRSAANHMATVYSVRDVKGCYIYSVSSTAVFHYTGSSCDTYWKGKLTGADANKIKLGGDGTSPYGTNATGIPYRILALKLC